MLGSERLATYLEIGTATQGTRAHSHGRTLHFESAWQLVWQRCTAYRPRGAAHILQCVRHARYSVTDARHKRA